MVDPKILRKEIDRLIRYENDLPLPLCPHDGKPCSNPERGCMCHSWPDGEEEKLIWRCERFKPWEVMNHHEDR